METARSGSETSLQIKRTFAASREKVFRAWTKPEELVQWFSPTEEYEVSILKWELRPGGEYRLQMKHPSGNVHRLVGSFREIRPQEKLVYTWIWEGTEMELQPTVVTVEFRDLGNSTELLLTHELLLDKKLREDHTHGWTGCLDRLAKFVQSHE